MKFTKPSFLEKEVTKEYFLALILRNEKAEAIILEQDGRDLVALSFYEHYFEDSLENANTEEFLNALDKAITGAEDALPPNIETKKTIFGLKTSWVQDNKIKPEYLEKLKKAARELSLTPVGFITLNEAIVSLLQKDEGAPITAILAEVGKKYVSVSWVKAGKILETKSSEIHQSASFTVDTLLKHLESPEILPSRLLIYDSNEEISQEFIGHQWSKSLSFLHLPQIENLAPYFDANAMLLAASVQMGLRVTKGLTKQTAHEEIPLIEETEFAKEPFSKDFEKTELPKEEVVTETLEQTSPKEEEIDTVEAGAPAEFFGFLENADIAKTEKPKQEETKKEFTLEKKEEEIEIIPDKISYFEEERQEIPSKTMQIVPKIISVFNKIFNLGKKIPIRKPGGSLLNLKGPKLLIVPAIIVVLLVFTFIFFTLSAKATVTLNVKPDVSEKNQSVTFSTTKSDIKNNIVAVELVSVSEDGSDTVAATGVKSIGDKAKGTVTVFNNSNDSVTLSSGTKTTSSNGLVFTFDSGVTVASASGDPFSGTKPSTATVKVTASTFGTEYNLPSGTKFSIGTDPAIAAKNDNAFSGGTKKDITVVSKDDIAKLLVSLPKKLEDKAKNDISGKLSSDKGVLSGFVDETVDKKDFDKNAGDEAKQVTLTGTVTYQGISYNKNDLLDLTNSLFSSDKITINKDNLNINVKDVKVKTKGEIEANLNIQAILMPKIDNDTLTKEIAGKSLEKVKSKLQELPQVSSVNISISPSLPFLPKNLPGNSKKIKIVIKLNG